MEVPCPASRTSPNTALGSDALGLVGFLGVPPSTRRAHATGRSWGLLVPRQGLRFSPEQEGLKSLAISSQDLRAVSSERIFLRF